MALTLARTKDGRWGRGTGDKQYWFGTATFDSAYATSGESLTAADLGMSTIVTLQANSEDGFDFRYNYSGELLLAYEAYGGSTHIGTIAHDASATTNGADLQAAVSNSVANAIEENKWNGHIAGFEALCANNANIYNSQVGTAASASNPVYTVWDNNDAETETVTMIDVIGQADGAGLNANNIIPDQDMYVPTSTGIFIPVIDGTSGVSVEFDDNAADASLRMLTVAADSANETYPTSAKIGMQADSANQEVSSTFDLSAAVVRIAAFGTPADTPF